MTSASPDDAWFDDARPEHVEPHHPERGPTRAERRAGAARMVTVLSEALATQIGRLVASADPAPDGWWFTPRG